MYLVRVDMFVAPGRGAELERCWGEGQRVLKAQTGFHLATLSNSLGYPEKYSSLTRFECREDWQAAVRTELYQAWLRAWPEHLVVARPRPAEAYELVHVVGRSGERPDYGRLVEWNLDPGAGRRFEESRKEVFALRQRHAPGFVVSGLWRFLGNRLRYLGISGYVGNDERAHPEITAFDQAHPYTEYASTPPDVESYAIVERVSRGRRRGGSPN
jgi:heme-degrading monooxygenase HmoA